MTNVKSRQLKPITIRPSGNSMVVTVPTALMQMLGLKAGDQFIPFLEGDDEVRFKVNRLSDLGLRAEPEPA
jgi:antitoxin component of MazEF toxin-antitoxin module